MASGIVQFWRKLHGSVHPDEQAVFRRFAKILTFHAAFTGDL